MDNQHKKIKGFASITGAWIETMTKEQAEAKGIFASITGAWIETLPLSAALNGNLRVHHGRVD